jgi:integrase
MNCNTSTYKGIYRRGSTWTVHIHFTDRDGKPQQHKRGGFTTLQEARRYHAEYLSQIHSGRRSGTSKLRLGDYLTREWLPHRQHELKASTYNSYKNVIEAHIVPVLGQVRLEDMNARRVEAFYNKLQHPADESRGLSPKTIANVAGVLKTSMRDAVRLGYLTVNPISEARRPRGRSPEMNAWQPAELGAFLDAAATDRQAAVWQLAATTGMRRGEILGLRWADINFDEGILTIRSTRVATGGTVINDTPKTAKGARTISIDKVTLEALKRLKAKQAEQQLALGDVWCNDAGYVAVEEDGSPSHPLTFSRRFVTIGKQAGLPRIRLHDLRHSYVVAARRAGVDIKTVSERIGHADINVTLRVYDHVFRDDDSRAADETAELIYAKRAHRK